MHRLVCLPSNIKILLMNIECNKIFLASYRSTPPPFFIIWSWFAIPHEWMKLTENLSIWYLHVLWVNIHPVASVRLKLSLDKVVYNCYTIMLIMLNLTRSYYYITHWTYCVTEWQTVANYWYLMHTHSVIRNFITIIKHEVPECTPQS